MPQRLAKTTRRTLLGLAAGLGLASPAFAWPDRPVRIIVPYPPGGTTDIIARMVVPALQAQLGQPLVIENRGGASGSIGATAAARAPADGYTLFITITDTQAINPAIFKQMQYDPEADFQPVSLLTRVPFGLLAGPTLRAIPDFAGFIAAAKRTPGRLSYSSWGVGSTSHLAMERIAAWAGIELIHVPFTGGAPARQAVAAGTVDIMAVPAGEAAPMTRDGTTRILTVLAPQRLAILPAVPTLAEAGLDLTSGFWVALYAPVRTPAPIVARLNEAVGAALRTPELVANLATQSALPEHTTPDGLATLQRAERLAWGEAARNARVQMD
jgi:tripartite-type tricarboxylate transporter receptor subunit TctC